MPYHIHILRCRASRCKRMASVVLCDGQDEAVILCFRHGREWMKRLNAARQKAEAKVEPAIPPSVNDWIN